MNLDIIPTLVDLLNDKKSMNLKLFSLVVNHY